MEYLKEQVTVFLTKEKVEVLLDGMILKIFI